MKTDGIILVAAMMLPVFCGMSQEKAGGTVHRHDEFIDELDRRIDSIFLCSSVIYNYFPYLTENDFRKIAEELDVEVSAIKAIIEVEAGKSLSGLTSDGKPVVNYSAKTFLKKAAKKGVNLLKARKEHPKAFASPSRDMSENYIRLSEAMAVDTAAAVESTFWGMFQIGGFNYRKCGVETHSEFARRMGESEHEQLELFATFLRNCGMVEAIRQKNWRKFASMYNGPSYAKRGYHKKLADAYARYKKEPE